MPALSAGDHNSMAWADYGDAIAEDDEFDNDYDFVFWAQGPNLIVTAIEPGVIYGYLRPTYEITIANTGNGSSSAGMASLWVDGQYVCEFIDYSSLLAGQQTTVTCEGPSLALGPHAMQACVDVTNVDPESNEADNCLGVPLEVIPTSVHVRADGSGDCERHRLQ